MHTHRKACVLVRQEQIYFLTLLLLTAVQELLRPDWSRWKRVIPPPPPGQYENKSSSVYIFFQKQSCYQTLRSNWHHILLFFLNALICFFNTHLTRNWSSLKLQVIYSVSPLQYIQSKPFLQSYHSSHTWALYSIQNIYLCFTLSVTFNLFFKSLHQFITLLEPPELPPSRRLL